jgi:lysophospholipase L1-like esterase
MDLRGLKLAIYGDSLSTGTHGEGGYEKKLKESLCLSGTYNFAVGSSSLSKGSAGCMADLLEEGRLPEEADIILIWHGSNDWYWGVPIGNQGDREPDTFNGAISFVIERLRINFPNARIIWVTPIYRMERPDGVEVEGDAFRTLNKVGSTLLDYVEALDRSSLYHGFPLIDMRRLSGIHAYNSGFYLEDGVHPNRNGYELIHLILDHEIRRLIF